jgi:type I restriction enzyme R subunit
MQKIIDAEKSDIFDVLAYIAYALPPLTREERAGRAKLAISTQFSGKQQADLIRLSLGSDRLISWRIVP